jgi:hypothetical protein
MAKKVVRWLIFSVILALIPLGVTWIIKATWGHPVDRRRKYHPLPLLRRLQLDDELVFLLPLDFD